MKKYLIFILLFSIMALGDDRISLQNGKVNISTVGKSYFIKENDTHKTPYDILNSKNLIPLKFSLFGFITGPFWTKTTIINDSDEIKSLMIYSPHAGINILDNYIFKDDKLYKTYHLGDLREQSKREILDKYSVFSIILSPNDKIVIATKYQNYGVYKLGLKIEDQTTYLAEHDSNNFIFYFIGGFVFFYLCYSLYLYFKFNAFSYILLAIESVSVTLYMYAIYGFLYKFDVGLNLEFITLCAFILIYIATIVRILFVYTFFNMKNRYKKLSYVVFAGAFVFFIGILNSLYGQFVDEEAFKLLNYHLFFFLVHPFVWLFVGFYMWYKKEIGSVYFLLGHGLLTVVATIHTLSFFGIVPFVWYTQYLLNTALIFDSLFMMILQYFRSSKEIEMLRKQKDMLLEQSRFFSIGQAIGNITHQWRDPLTKIGSSLTMLESTLKNDKNNLEKKFTNELPVLHFSIKNMKSTINQFCEFYESSNESEIFKPKELINNKILKMLNSKLTLKNVHTSINIDDNFEINSHEHILSNIITVLINNSIDAFESAESLDKTITISMRNENTKTILEYQDNAGGIKIYPLEKVFEYFTSSKQSKNQKGHGIGLAMVKILVNEQLKGTISAHNTTDGAKFVIVF